MDGCGNDGGFLSCGFVSFTCFSGSSGVWDPGPEGVVMIPAQSAKGPMKMVFTAPLQWKAMTVPFEMKGLALPEAK